MPTISLFLPLHVCSFLLLGEVCKAECLFISWSRVTDRLQRHKPVRRVGEMRLLTPLKPHSAWRPKQIKIIEQRRNTRNQYTGKKSAMAKNYRLK